LMVLQPQGLQRAPQRGRAADRRADLLDAERVLPHRRQGPIAPRLAFAVLPRRGLPSHAWPPGAACTRCCRAPAPAPLPRAAASTALRTASLTSFAFPVAIPTRPCPSPTATSALNPKRRPPFTTLATRLIEITFSTRPSPSRCRSPPSSRRGPPRPRPRGPRP